jgi:hypothetical protein
MDNGPTDPYHFASLIAYYDVDVTHIRAGIEDTRSLFDTVGITSRRYRHG